MRIIIENGDVVLSHGSVCIHMGKQHDSELLRRNIDLIKTLMDKLQYVVVTDMIKDIQVGSINR